MLNCLCVFVGGREGGEKRFQDCGWLVSASSAHGFPSECAGFV